ncbi:hypothetical protein F5B22DRAFT_651357 [Xylaria bambusicola]|uniref:uncharacterized protein n=1 Tax=Xylaria bambusicola TaxID=326684 RepID=UPI00200782EA|nr:uncharacterized protein F5B22DRAFT_651357 [Xylaria bambusicola]KAI0505811.1 hypothetical protein F5B22DRAFT_651357 [Xylaria bambusicola]
MTTRDENSNAPQRIVLQTKTHQVPGGDYQERCRRMKNLLCQHLWNRDFDYEQDRWQAYGAAFAYEGRRCYFLLDHGQSSSNNVPVLWYKWTGTSFELIEGPLPPQMRAKLKDYPFIRPKREPSQAKESSPPDPATRRQMIRHKPRSNMKIAPVELELLGNPDQVALLKAEVDPRFWNQIDDFARVSL